MDFDALRREFGDDYVILFRVILFGGLSLWIYIILWLIVPKAPKRLNA